MAASDASAQEKAGTAQSPKAPEVRGALETLAALLAQASAARAEFEAAWAESAAVLEGKRFTCELRIVAVDRSAAERVNCP